MSITESVSARGPKENVDSREPQVMSRVYISVHNAAGKCETPATEPNTEHNVHPIQPWTAGTRLPNFA